MPILPVDSRRLYEQVAAQIGDLIRSAEFSPGQRLPAERELAKMLGVSRPVVREAMIALEIGGLVEVRTGSGAFVCERPRDQTAPINAGNRPSDILNARMLIEGEIAALAASNASPEDIAAMSLALDQMKRDHDEGRSWRAADMAFHVAIARASGNATLTSVVERLWQEQHAPFFSLLSERVRLVENWTETVRGHREILHAIRSGKPEAAKESMRAHLRQVLRVLTGDSNDALF